MWLGERGVFVAGLAVLLSYPGGQDVSAGLVVQVLLPRLDGRCDSAGLVVLLSYPGGRIV